MLEEGYVEILAPTMDTPNAQRVRERMKRYDGVHLACFGTPDARCRARAARRAGLRARAAGRPAAHDRGRRDRCASASSTCRRRRCPRAASSTASTSRPRQIWRDGFVEPRCPPRGGLRRRRRSGRGRGALGALLRPAAAPRRTASSAWKPRAAGCVIGTRAALERLLGERTGRRPSLAGYALSCRRSGGIRRALPAGPGRKTARPRSRSAARARRDMARLESTLP